MELLRFSNEASSFVGNGLSWAHSWKGPGFRGQLSVKFATVTAPKVELLTVCLRTSLILKPIATLGNDSDS